MNRGIFLCLSLCFFLVNCRGGSSSSIVSGNQNSSLLNAPTHNWYWNDATLQNGAEFHMSESLYEQFGDDFVDGVENLMETWNQAHPDHIFFSEQSLNRTDLENLSEEEAWNDGSNGIYGLTSWPASVDPKDTANILAFVSPVLLYESTSQIDEVVQAREADVFLNLVDFSFAPEMENQPYDLLTILSHEIGHVTGLGHTPRSNTSSIMNSQLSPFTIFRVPAEVDTESLIELYDTYPEQDDSSALKADGDYILGKKIVYIRKDHKCSQGHTIFPKIKAKSRK